MKVGQSVPKRRYVKLRRRGIIQKKEYDIHNSLKWKTFIVTVCRDLSAQLNSYGLG